MSELNNLFGPAKTISPASQTNELLFEGRLGSPYIGVGQLRLTADRMDAVLQSYGPANPQAKIMGSETGVYETENANVSFGEDAITLTQPSGEPYRYYRPSGSAKLLRIDYDLGFMPQALEIVRLALLVEESGVVAAWTSTLSNRDGINSFPERMGTLWATIEVTGAGNKNEEGTAQLLIRGLLLEAVECPVDFGDDQQVQPVISGLIGNPRVVGLIRNIGVEMLLSEPITVQAEVISIKDD
jgi:hypothetical protein